MASKAVLRWMLLAAFTAAVVGLPLRGAAENNCPWMNEATASDLVGADAVGSFVSAKDAPSVCTFTQTGPNGTRTLQIAMAIATDPHGSYMANIKSNCTSSSVPLKAIGNEAVTCMVDRRKVIVGEKALGRVRDQVFTITLSTSMKDDPILTPAMLKMKIEFAAEQVAGNLY